MYEIFERLMQERGITAYRVHKETGVPQSSLSDWKYGKSIPKIDKLKKIATYFGVSVEYLMGEEEKKEAPALNDEDRRDIAARLKELRDDLTTADGLMFDGMKLNEQTLDFLMSSLERDITTATLLAKQRDQKENKKD